VSEDIGEFDINKWCWSKWPRHIKDQEALTARRSLVDGFNKGVEIERERIIKELTKDCETFEDGSIWPQPHIRLDNIIKIVRGES